MFFKEEEQREFVRTVIEVSDHLDLTTLDPRIKTTNNTSSSNRKVIYIPAKHYNAITDKLTDSFNIKCFDDYTEYDSLERIEITINCKASSAEVHYKWREIEIISISDDDKQLTLTAPRYLLSEILMALPDLEYDRYIEQYEGYECPYLDQMIELGITAYGEPNFECIDRRILHTANWKHSYPGSTDILVPKHCAFEIIEKLKKAIQDDRGGIVHVYTDLLHESEEVTISAIYCLNFEAINPEIGHGGRWIKRSHSVMETIVYLPKQMKTELIAQLKEQPAIISIDNESLSNFDETNVSAMEYLDFRTIDPRIIHFDRWLGCPASTQVHTRKTETEELRKKIAEHPEVTSVDGIMTEHGEEVNRNRSNSFPK